MEASEASPSITDVEADLSLFVAAGARRWRTTALGMNVVHHLASVRDEQSVMSDDASSKDPNLPYDAIEASIESAIHGLPEPHAAAALSQFGFTKAGKSGLNDSKTAREDLAAAGLGKSGRWYRTPNQRAYGGLKPAVWHVRAVAVRLVDPTSDVGTTVAPAPAPGGEPYLRVHSPLLEHAPRVGLIGAYPHRRDVPLDTLYAELEAGEHVFIASRHLESLKYRRVRSFFSRLVTDNRGARLLVTPAANLDRVGTFLGDLNPLGQGPLQCRSTVHLEAAMYGSSSGAFITLYGHSRAGDDSPVLHCRPSGSSDGLYELYKEEFEYIWDRAETVEPTSP